MVSQDIAFLPEDPFGQQIGEMGYSTQNVWLPTIGLHFKKVNISVQIKLSNKALISFNSF